MTTPVLILAAGAARRFGRPKQLAEVDGESLVARAVATVWEASMRPVVVVGAHREAVREVLGGTCETVVAESWEEGIGASLRAGVRSLGADVGRFMVLACDQPLVGSDDLRRLEAASRGGDAAAAAYDGVVGVPACFDAGLRSRFDELSGDRGAGPMLRSSAIEVVEVPMPGAVVDVDRPGDLATVRGDSGRGASG